MYNLYNGVTILLNGLKSCHCPPICSVRALSLPIMLPLEDSIAFWLLLSYKNPVFRYKRFSQI